jgi:hypothetical protein
MINKRLIILILGVALIIGGIFLFIRLLAGRGQGQAILKIKSTPSATVFLDTQHLGKTPYEGKAPSGEYTLKLVPESGSFASSWETKIKLAPSVLTYINRELTDQELTSAGEILTLDKISSPKGEIAVLSNPDGAQVSLDNQEPKLTPTSFLEVDEGNHELSISSPGFKSRSIEVKITPGFKLVVSVQLAFSSEASPSASPSPSPSGTPKPTTSPKAGASPKPTVSPAVQIPKPYVTISQTCWPECPGQLRVRVEPDKTATEAARVDAGDSFPLLEQKSGWYKIRYEGTKEGWISSQYAKKFE